MPQSRSSNALCRYTLLDDAWVQRRHGHALLLALPAGPRFALDDFNVVLGRLDVEHHAHVVADEVLLQAALAAQALLACAGDDLFRQRQIGGKRLPAGMRAPLPFLFVVRLRLLLALALGLHLLARNARL